MRNHIIRIFATSVATLTLSGCSFLVEIILYNNSDSRIEVCNLSHTNQRCQIIEPRSFNRILLVADRKIDSWEYSISQTGKTRIYNFAFEPYPAQASDIYCEGFLIEQCDIPLQYESDSLLYWAGNSQELPVVSFPDQPPGFPVAPEALKLKGSE